VNFSLAFPTRHQRSSPRPRRPGSHGHNPLLFFLKCLSDHSELDDLIRREIEAAKFFLLCDSPNSQASRWVQHEVELIKSMKG